VPRIKRKAPPHAFKKGQSGNPAGRPKGIKDQITQAKIRIMARTGMLPLDFMTAVYRDQLFEFYDEHTTEDGKATYFTPAPGARQIAVNLAQRLSAASAASPYVHKKMPVGIEVGNRNASIITAEALRKLKPKELENLLALMDKLDIGAEFEGHAAPVFDENGAPK
jgi:hypothetical protein